MSEWVLLSDLVSIVVDPAGPNVLLTAWHAGHLQPVIQLHRDSLGDYTLADGGSRLTQFRSEGLGAIVADITVV